MKIVVFSDTHGHLEKVYEVMSKIENADLIIHCGDYAEDGEILSSTLNIPAVCVRGNCDRGPGSDMEIVETEGGNILVVHGDMYGVSYDVTRLLYAAEENDCSMVCFGHTHVPMNEDMDGIILFNPGSLPRPRDGSNGSYGIILAEKETLYANIVYYDTVVGKGGKSDKTKGGRIRGMLNYSDRF